MAHRLTKPFNLLVKPEWKEELTRKPDSGGKRKKTPASNRVRAGLQEMIRLAKDNDPEFDERIKKYSAKEYKADGGELVTYQVCITEEMYDEIKEMVNGSSYYQYEVLFPIAGQIVEEEKKVQIAGIGYPEFD